MPIPQLKPVEKSSQPTDKVNNVKQIKLDRPENNEPLRQPIKKKKSSRKKRILKNLIIAVLICILVGIIFIIAVFAWYSRDLPDPDKINDRNLEQSTRIYDRTGEIILYEIHGDTNRTLIKLEDIPDSCQKATIAIEDAKFYEHKGIDLKGITRAVIAHLFNSDVQGGGSTITQQFIKNAILTNDYSYIRKIKEAILAYQMERKFTKDQILQLYLNEIPYGSTAYGIESAAQLYFGKSASILNDAECATLAALPQSPSYYMNHREILMGRKDYILERMNELDYLSTSDMNTALAEEVTLDKHVTNITAPHFVFYVKELLEETYGTKKVEQGGLKVITTLDVFHQEKAEEAVAENVEKNLNNYNAENAALVSMDTKTGQITAMVGSKDFFDETIDGQVNVATSLRQPGSSFKPFVYLTAFAAGYTPETMLFDLETDFQTGTGIYHPHNYDYGERGPIAMKKALMGSLNIPAVKTLYLIGIDEAVTTAEKFGYTSFTNTDNYGLALVLGGAEVNLIEHTAAYAALAREGDKHPTTAILKVEDNDGKILEEWSNSSEQVFDNMAVRSINSILSNDSLRSFVFGAGTRLTLPDRQVASKTGTTNDYRDGWTMGYTPSLAAGVWAGNNDNSEMKNGGGFTVAAPIWNAYMQKVLPGTTTETFQPAPNNNAAKPILQGQIDEVTTTKVDKFSGEIIPEECLDSYPEDYIIEKDIKQTHTILHYVNKDDPRGNFPANPAVDTQYNNWEARVQLWAAGQAGYMTEETSYADCNQRNAGNQPKITLLTPKSKSYDNDDFEIEIDYKTTTSRKSTKVEYMIDTTIIETNTTPPFVSIYSPINLTSGKHTLTVTIYDDKNNFDIDSVDFEFENTTPTTTNTNLNTNSNTNSN